MNDFLRPYPEQNSGSKACIHHHNDAYPGSDAWIFTLMETADCKLVKARIYVI